MLLMLLEFITHSPTLEDSQRNDRNGSDECERAPRTCFQMNFRIDLVCSTFGIQSASTSVNIYHSRILLLLLLSVQQFDGFCHCTVNNDHM